MDVVHHPPAALAALRRLGRARHRPDRPRRPGVERPGPRRRRTATSSWLVVIERLAAATTRAELIAEGQARGLLVTPVNEVTDVPKDAHLAARDFFVDVEQPDGDHACASPGSPFRSDRGRGDVAPPRELGADDGILPSSPAARRRPAATAPPARSAPAARRRPHRRLHVGHRRLVRHPAARRPRRRRDQARVGEPPRPDPPHRAAADRRRLARHQRRVPGRGAGKRAVTLNVDTPEGRELVRRLDRHRRRRDRQLHARPPRPLGLRPGDAGGAAAGPRSSPTSP